MKNSLKKKAVLTLAICLFAIPFFPTKVQAEEINLQKAIIPENAIEVKTSESLEKMASDLGMDVRTFERTETIKSKSKTSETENVKTTDIYFTPKNYKEIVPYGSQEVSDDIVYYAANVYSKIYYSTKTKNNAKYVKLTKVTGGVRDIDTGFQVLDQRITYICKGSYDGNPSGTQRIVKTTNSLSYTYSCPSSWAYVNSQANPSVGLTDVVRIKHGGSIYTGTHFNYY